MGPRWHPDSKRLFFLSDRGDGNTLEPHEIDIATGEVQSFRLGEVGALEPWFSPDGRRVAFHRANDDGLRLWWADAYGSGARPVAAGDLLTVNPVWSRDGKLLAFSEGESPTFRIRLVDEEGKTVFSVPNEGPGLDVPRTLDLEAALLLFHSDRDERNIFQTYLYDIATGETRQLTFGPHLNGVPNLSPDARTILFESNRDGIVDLYVMDLDDLEPRRIFLPAGHSDDVTGFIYSFAHTGRENVARHGARPGVTVTRHRSRLYSWVSGFDPHTAAPLAFRKTRNPVKNSGRWEPFSRITAIWDTVLAQQLPGPDDET